MLDRKKDAREKIQLGGLIVKAGLRKTDKAILLGILMDASNRLGDMNERDRWRVIGKAAFKNDTQKGAAVPDPDSPHANGTMGPHRD
ncbi:MULTISPECIES: conjugal transfer protein TraD [Stappiaceae]|uniref:conjugal transfer protein TraD n=1 Tax=Stappiaceae TaxID=2821832 RepID=UPI0001946FC6|nr:MULTISPECIES: conjugal transfer protein TraD [Stappiaceae]